MQEKQYLLQCDFCEMACYSLQKEVNDCKVNLNKPLFAIGIQLP